MVLPISADRLAYNETRASKYSWIAAFHYGNGWCLVASHQAFLGNNLADLTLPMYIVVPS